MKHYKLWKILMLLLIATIIQAKADSIPKRSWHFYGTILQAPKNLVKKKLSDQAARQAVIALKEHYQAAIDRALLDPSDENIHEAQQLHLEIVQKALAFEKSWHAALLLNLDKFNHVEEPTSAYGIDYQHSLKEKKFQKTIKQFNENGGLIYFYKSQCHYCKHFDPIIQSFADLNHIKIRPISCDQRASPHWPNTLIASEKECLKLNIHQTPAVLAALPREKKLFYVSIGLVSHEILKQNLQSLLELIGENQ